MYESVLLLIYYKITKGFEKKTLKKGIVNFL